MACWWLLFASMGFIKMLKSSLFSQLRAAFLVVLSPSIILPANGFDFLIDLVGL